MFGSCFPGYSAYVAKYDSLGVKQWGHIISAMSGTSNSPTSIALDSLGFAYLVGSTSVNLDGHTKSGSRDSFVYKIDGNTGLQPNQQSSVLIQIDGGATTNARACVMNSQDELHMAGSWIKSGSPWSILTMSMGLRPTTAPTMAPSSAPTQLPTNAPSISPTGSPTASPTPLVTHMLDVYWSDLVAGNTGSTNQRAAHVSYECSLTRLVC